MSHRGITIYEHVEIGRAIEAELRKRHGVRRDTLPDVENFPPVPEGKTRDLAADKAGFGNGKTYEQAKYVIDHGAPELVSAVDAGRLPGIGPPGMTVATAFGSSHVSSGVAGDGWRILTDSPPDFFWG